MSSSVAAVSFLMISLAFPWFPHFSKSCPLVHFSVKKKSLVLARLLISTCQQIIYLWLCQPHISHLHKLWLYQSPSSRKTNRNKTNVTKHSITRLVARHLSCYFQAPIPSTRSPAPLPITLPIANHLSLPFVSFSIRTHASVTPCTCFPLARNTS